MIFQKIVASFCTKNISQNILNKIFQSRLSILKIIGSKNFLNSFKLPRLAIGFLGANKSYEKEQKIYLAPLSFSYFFSFEIYGIVNFRGGWYKAIGKVSQAWEGKWSKFIFYNPN